jgi:hypothetical protein
LLGWLCLPGGSTQAEPPQPVQISITGADTLTRDTHTALGVVVTLPPEGAEMPLALTPHVDGSAVELVRGRLLRADAKQARAGELHFAIPVVARSEGTAILRVDLMTYACDPACRRIDVHGARVLHVR